MALRARLINTHVIHDTRRQAASHQQEAILSRRHQKMTTPNATAPIRVEVLLNGRRIAIAGIEKFGVISAIVTWVRRNPANITATMRSEKDFDETHFLREICELELSGLDSVRDKHVFWAKDALRPGSEVTIRILPAGEFDAPRSDRPR